MLARHDDDRLRQQLELLLRAVQSHVWDAVDLQKLNVCIKGIGVGSRHHDGGDREFSAQEYLSASESERLIFYSALVETLRKCRPATAPQLDAARCFLQSRLDWRIPDYEQEETRRRIAALVDGAALDLENHHGA